MKFINFVMYRDLDRIAGARPAHLHTRIGCGHKANWRSADPSWIIRVGVSGCSSSTKSFRETPR